MKMVSKCENFTEEEDEGYFQLTSWWIESYTLDVVIGIGIIGNNSDMWYPDTKTFVEKHLQPTSGGPCFLRHHAAHHNISDLCLI